MLNMAVQCEDLQAVLLTLSREQSKCIRDVKSIDLVLSANDISQDRNLVRC